MKTVEERLKSYEPLWENWTYSGEFLGEGAMSSVFEIQSTAMGFREVAALKIITIKKNYRGEVKIPESALNEIKILRDLSGCPNIVRYHDSTQRQIYDRNNKLSEIDILIKMEKLQPLSESDKLSEEQIINLAKDICQALIHASEHGIIHRDIKPQNIFVDDEGTYKLGDFGIAKIISDIKTSYTMNIGTLAYAAPEIHNNTSGVYDISSDVYSLGLVLYVFLNNGCMPFVASTSSLNEAISKRLNGAAFPSPARGSKNLKTIVMRACSSDRAKRYKTPEEMLEDLELLSTGGKKLVVDPFATLDANLNVTEFDEEYLRRITGRASVATDRLRGRVGRPDDMDLMSSTFEKSDGGGRRSDAEDKKTIIHGAELATDDALLRTTGGSRLKINMTKSGHEDETEGFRTTDKKVFVSSGESRLKINMNTTRPKDFEEDEKVDNTLLETPDDILGDKDSLEMPVSKDDKADEKDSLEMPVNKEEKADEKEPEKKERKGFLKVPPSL